MNPFGLNVLFKLFGLFLETGRNLQSRSSLAISSSLCFSANRRSASLNQSGFNITQTATQRQQLRGKNRQSARIVRSFTAFTMLQNVIEGEPDCEDRSVRKLRAEPGELSLWLAAASERTHFAKQVFLPVSATLAIIHFPSTRTRSNRSVPQWSIFPSTRKSNGAHTTARSLSIRTSGS